jgi:hypothetical protein
MTLFILFSPAEPVFVNVYGAPESIAPAYVAWRASTTNRVSYRPASSENRYLVSLKDLQLRGQGIILRQKPEINVLCHRGTELGCPRNSVDTEFRLFLLLPSILYSVRNWLKFRQNSHEFRVI